MIEEVKQFAEELVKSITVETLFDEEENPIFEIMISEKDMGKVIGKNGKMIKAIRTLIQTVAYNKGVKRVKINVDSF